MSLELIYYLMILYHIRYQHALTEGFKSIDAGFMGNFKAQGCTIFLENYWKFLLNRHGNSKNL